MSEMPQKTDERRFVQVVQLSSALGLGVMTGFLFSLKQVRPTLEFQFGAIPAVAAVAGGIFSWFFWKALFGEPDPGADPVQAARTRRIWIFIFLGVLTAGMLASFALSLRNVEQATLIEVIKGTVGAAAALSISFSFFWKSVQFLEKDIENAEKNNPPPSPKP